MSRPSTSSEDVISRIFPLQFFRGNKNSSPSSNKKPKTTKEQTDGIDLNSKQQNSSKQKIFGDLFKRNEKQTKNTSKIIVEVKPDVIEESSKMKLDLSMQASSPPELSPDKYDSSNESIAKYQARRLQLLKQDSFDLGPIEIDMIPALKSQGAAPSTSIANQNKIGLWNKMTSRLRPRKSDTIANPSHLTESSMKSHELKLLDNNQRSATFDSKHSLVPEKNNKEQNISFDSRKDSKKVKLAKVSPVESTNDVVDNHYKKRFSKIFNRPSSPRQTKKKEEIQNTSKTNDPVMDGVQKMTSNIQMLAQESEVVRKKKIDSIFHRLKTSSDTNLLEIQKKKNSKQGYPIFLGMKENQPGKISEEVEELKRISRGRVGFQIGRPGKYSTFSKQASSTEMLPGTRDFNEYRKVNTMSNACRAKSTPDIISDDVIYFDKKFKDYKTPDGPKEIINSSEQKTQRSSDDREISFLIGGNEVDILSDFTAHSAPDSPKMPSHPPPPPPQVTIPALSPPPLPPRSIPLTNDGVEISIKTDNQMKIEREISSTIDRPNTPIPSSIDSRQSLPVEIQPSSNLLMSPVGVNSATDNVTETLTTSVKEQNADKLNDFNKRRLKDIAYDIDNSTPNEHPSKLHLPPIIDTPSHDGFNIAQRGNLSPRNTFKNKMDLPSNSKEDSKKIDLLQLRLEDSTLRTDEVSNTTEKQIVRFLNHSNSEDGHPGGINNNFEAKITPKARHRMSVHNFNNSNNKDGGEQQKSVFAPIRMLRRKTTVAEFNQGANMFGRKAQADVKKSAAKVLDVKKDTVTRLKHLRIVIESYDENESKMFFEQFYSHIYFLFHEGFSSVEASLGQRANKAHREELDFMLFIFEKILIYLPEMIHKRWQVHSIGRIMKKLLHPGNSLKLRREGLRLFLVWYQILMENATEDCHNMFCSLVWGGKLSSLSQDVDLDIFTIKTFQNTKASVPEIGPLIPPQSGDKTPSNLTRYFLEALLYCMVSEVNKVEWTNKESRCFAFMFLFNKFKKFYLLQFFPDFDFTFSIYHPDLNLPDPRNIIIPVKPAITNTMVVCQEIIVKWFFTYCNHFVRSRRSGNQLVDLPSDTTDPISQGDDFQPNEINSSTELQVPAISDPSDPSGPGSNNSTLSLGSSLGGVEKSVEGVADPNICLIEGLGENFGGFVVDEEAVKLVKDMLYSTRENVNIVHEVFRQAFLWSGNDEELNSARNTVNVYKDWFWCVKTKSELPPFLKENLDDNSEISPMKDGNNFGNSAGMGTGLQNVLRVFFTISSNVFLTFFDFSNCSSDQSHSSVQRLSQRLEKQVEICKRVLNIYRYSVTNLHMDIQTWEQLLFVLLKVTSVVMSREDPASSHAVSLAKNLAEPLFKTLIVTWIKANTNFSVSPSLWQQFTVVLSSLTYWMELIKEWAKVMEVMTRIFSKFVYGLNLNDLPLNRLTEQKVKRLKGTRGVKATYRARAEKSGDLQKESSQDLIRASVSSKTITTRQRSRSGDLSPLLLSTTDVANDNTTTSNLSGNGPNFLNLPMTVSTVSIVRSSSDNSLIRSADRHKDSETSPKEILDNSKSVCEHSLPELNKEFASLDNIHVQVAADNEDVMKDAVETDLIIDQGQADENAAEFFEEKSFKVETRLAKLDDFSYASSRSGHDTESLASLDVQRISKVPYISMLEQGNESMTGERSDNEYLLTSLEGDNILFVEDAKEGRDNKKKNLASEEIVDDDDDEDVADIVDEIVGNQCESFEDKKDDFQVLFSEQPHSSPQIHDPDHRPPIQQNEDVTSSFDSSSQQLDHLQTPPTKVNSQGRAPISGWNSDLTSVLWCRLLGSLGNINSIEEPSIHLAALECLSDIVDVFVCVRDNQSVSLDNLSSPPPPKIVPPFLYVSSWLFDSLCLGSKYQKSAMLSLKVLCKVMLRRHDDDIPLEHLVRFYLCLHLGLLHSNEKATNILIRHCSPRFLSLAYPGFSLLFQDFITAAENTLVVHKGGREVPRVHAMALLGNLMTYINYFHCKIPVLDPALNDPTLKAEGADIKEVLVNVLLKLSQIEPVGRSRCVSLSCLGMYLYEAMGAGSIPAKFDEILNILLSSISSDDIFVSQTAASTLVLLSDYIKLMIEKGPRHVYKIIEELATTTSVLLREVESTHSRASKDVLQKTINEALFAILEWCMKTPLPLMIRMPDVDPILYKSSIPGLSRVFHVLQEILLGIENTPPLDISHVTETSNISTASHDDDREGSANTSSSTNHQQTPPGIHGYPPSTAMSPMSVKVLHESFPNESKSIKSGGALDLNLSQRSLVWSQGGILTDSPVRMDNNLFGIQLAASAVLQHLVNYFGYFPFSKDSMQLCCSSQEHLDHQLFHWFKIEELSSSSCSDLRGEDILWSNVLKASDVQFFLLNGRTLMSVMELPSFEISPLAENSGPIASFMPRHSPWCRFTFRDVSGKFTWDVTPLHHLPAPPVDESTTETPTQPSPPPSFPTSSPAFPLIGSAGSSVGPLTSIESKQQDRYKPSTFSQQFLNTFSLPLPALMMSSFSFFSSTHLLTHKSTAKPWHSEDLLDSTLSYIGHVSPECLFDPSQQLNIPCRPHTQISLMVEDQLMQTIASQGDEIKLYVDSRSHKSKFSRAVSSTNNHSSSRRRSQPEFQLFRRLFNSFGSFSWERRSHFDLINKNERFLRELKHLDNQRCQETHKIAVIYVGPGQEDKMSILSNQEGSQKFHSFINSLGLMVNLRTHCGFMGGLQNNGSTGEYAPYYSTSTKEVMFHVSTFMPGDNEEDKLRKLRHLGNDEVHIIWSEHLRDYRHGIIPTDFGEVLIVIYPLDSGLFRVQIKQKQGVPHFGPLFDEAIISSEVLAGLVRATVINAGNALRTLREHYQSHYESRYNQIVNIAHHYRSITTFEDFSFKVINPGQTISVIKEAFGDRDIIHFQDSKTPRDVPLASQRKLSTPKAKKHPNKKHNQS